jgi:hypothetical protein
MKIFLVTILVVVLAFGGIFLYRDYYMKRKVRKLSDQKYRIVAPIVQRISSGEVIPESEMLHLVRDPSSRHTLITALVACRRPDLFPASYMTFEKGAESSLVNWLEFPTELGVPPDEIEFVEKVSLGENGDLDYYVFRYRMMRRHWAKRIGWMVGVSGPYNRESNPYDIPRQVFSRFRTIESTSAQSEVSWVHENVNINMRQ